MAISLDDERKCLEAARQGERQSLEAFYAAYHGTVYAFCRRLVTHAQDAEDVLQATFIAAFRALPRFRGESRVKTWLYRIAFNEAMRLRSHRGNQEEALEDDYAADPTTDIAERLAVHCAMAKMRPDQRALLVLLYWEQLSYEEIAEVLGVSLSAAKMRLNRAREAFQKRSRNGIKMNHSHRSHSSG